MCRKNIDWELAVSRKGCVLSADSTHCKASTQVLGIKDYVIDNVQNPDVRKQAVCEKATVERLVTLLASEEPSLRVSAACNVASLCAAPKQQEAAMQAGAIQPLVV